MRNTIKRAAAGTGRTGGKLAGLLVLHGTLAYVSGVLHAQGRKHGENLDRADALAGLKERFPERFRARNEDDRHRHPADTEPDRPEHGKPGFSSPSGTGPR